MAMVAGDWTIDRGTKAIRYVGDDHGGTPTYATVIQFHRWLQDFADQEVSSGDDELDITDSTPSERSTDNIITLKNSYNIDDNAAEHLYDGSIIQGTGGSEVYYDGIVNFGNAGVQIQIIQNGAVLADDWWNQAGAGVNADATNGISHRFMIKTRTGGANIDNRRIIGLSREYGNTYSEFNINSTARGNNVLALTDANDLNNETIATTIATYTGVANVKEGYSAIDVNNDTTNEYYYSEWNTNQPTRSINDFYERLKWLSESPQTEDSNADTGSDFIVGDGTNTGQAQSFQNGVNAMLLTKAVFNLKKTLAPTGTAVATLYAITGTFGTTSTPTGAALATSNTFDVTTLDTTYRPIVFKFATPYTMVASTNYCIALDYSSGNSGNYVNVQGLASSGTHAGNQSVNTGTWAAGATDDLGFEAYSSAELYGLPGTLFRGITHEVDITANTGTWVEPEQVTWGSGATAGVGQLLAVDDTDATATTKMWIQLLSGVVPAANEITGAGSATGTAGTITSRTLSTPFVGASTGSAIIGAYGLGIEKADLTAADKVFDLTNNQITPPNNVTFTVFGLYTGEDRVLVTNDQTSAIDYDQMTLNTTLVAVGEVAVDVGTGNIPDDTPSTGNLRIQLDDGRYRLVPYTAHDSDDGFTIGSTDFSGGDTATSGNNVFLSYIDELAGSNTASFTTVYTSNRTLFVRVRDGGTAGDNESIKTFETTGVLSSSGGSSTAIRTPDE